MNQHTFVVKRSEWLRGEHSFNSLLLRECDNKKCCLGFYALSCGVPKEKILDQGYLDQVWDARFSKSLLGELLEQVMFTNDTRYFCGDDFAREEKLKELFQKADIEIIFED